MADSARRSRGRSVVLRCLLRELVFIGSMLRASLRSYGTRLVHLGMTFAESRSVRCT